LQASALAVVPLVFAHVVIGEHVLVEETQMRPVVMVQEAVPQKQGPGLTEVMVVWVQTGAARQMQPFGSKVPHDPGEVNNELKHNPQFPSKAVKHPAGYTRFENT